jgi:hypothetical protein
MIKNSLFKKNFEMKLFLLGLLVLGIPAYYLIRIILKEKTQNKKQRQLGLAYDRLIKKGKFSVEHSELLNGKLIALDRKNKKLLIIDHNQIEKQEECLSLLGVESCKIIEVKHAADACIKKIFIELNYKQNNKITRFYFFDDSYDLITELPTLARKAKFWKHRINLHKYPGRVNLELEYVL